MNFKTGSTAYKFVPVTIDRFIEKHKLKNPKEDLKKLRSDLLYFKQLKLKGEKCNCGNSIWIIGSAIAGKGCFTCITGESDFSNDYEIE